MKNLILQKIDLYFHNEKYTRNFVIIYYFLIFTLAYFLVKRMPDYMISFVKWHPDIPLFTFWEYSSSHALFSKVIFLFLIYGSLLIHPFFLIYYIRHREEFLQQVNSIKYSIQLFLCYLFSCTLLAIFFSYDDPHPSTSVRAIVDGRIVSIFFMWLATIMPTALSFMLFMTIDSLYFQIKHRK